MCACGGNFQDLTFTVGIHTYWPFDSALRYRLRMGVFYFPARMHSPFCPCKLKLGLVNFYIVTQRIK